MESIPMILMTAASTTAQAAAAREARKAKPKPPITVVQPTAVQGEAADIARDEVLKRLAKLRRATQLSELSQPNVKRTRLGAGAI